MSHKISLVCTLLALSTALQSEEQKDLVCCGTGRHMQRLSARHIEGNGIGYSTGYTTLEGFFSSDYGLTWLPFLDVRGHVFNNGKFAANIGIGGRCQSETKEWIFGANVYCDWRNTHHHNFEQVGVGLEALSPLWEVRANGYIPVGNRASDFFGTTFDHFQGNRIVIEKKRELALYGADAEAGSHLMKCDDFDVFAGIGPYYFGGQGAKDFFGGKFRLNASWKEYIALEGTVSYDRVFRDIYQGQITFSLPLGKTKGVPKRSCSSCCSSLALDRRMTQPVVRDEILVLTRKKYKTLAVNPATGLPFNVLFVNNLSHSLGTFESPYSTLASAQNASNANDIIYVMPGDGTSRNMDTGITLKNGQQLLSTSSAQTLNTSIGYLTIPAQTTTLTPTISNAGTVITAANNNTISGLCLEVGTIGISASNVSGLIVKGNTIQTSSTGISLTNVGGQTLISDNFINTGDTGLQVTNTTVNHGYVLVNNNALFTNNNNSNAIAMSLTNCTDISTDILNNSLFSQDAPLNITATNATVPSTGNSFFMLRNTLSSQQNASYAITLSQNALTFLTLVENTSSNVANGMDLSLNNASQTTLSLYGNKIDHNGAALAIIASNSSSLAADIQNNNLAGGSSSSTFFALLGDTSSTAFFVDGNTIEGSLTQQAIQISSNNTSHTAWTVSNNHILARTDGLLLDGANSAVSALSFANNLVTGAHGVALKLSGSDPFQSAWDVQNNVFNANAQAANITSPGVGGTLCLVFQHNKATPVAVGATPAYQLTQSGGTFKLVPLTDNVGVLTQTGTFTPVSSCN